MRLMLDINIMLLCDEYKRFIYLIYVTQCTINIMTVNSVPYL